MSDFLLDMICTPPLDESGAEIERGEFDQAFWKNMASRKVCTITLIKTTGLEIPICPYNDMPVIFTIVLLFIVSGK